MTEKKSFQEIIQSDKPVLVDFFAEWCAPCKMMKPILDELKAMIGDGAVILKVDVDKNESIAKSLEIRGIPTLAIFKEGKMLWRKSGVMSAAQLQEVIQKYI